MDKFIHTFSLAVNISSVEKIKLLNSFRWMPLTGTNKANKAECSIIEYCECGVQILVCVRDQKEIKYDKNHNKYRMEIVVTPYKLLYPGCALGAITDFEDLCEAIEELDEIINEIEDETGIMIRENYKIRRVDLTCDVSTPLDEYSREIIAMTKVVKLPYGYRRCEPTEEELELYNWDKNHGSLFYNQCQSVFAKVYNKKENLKTDVKNRQEYDNMGDKGLVRFELELTRAFLMKNDLLKDDDISRCLIIVMCRREEIFKKYFADNMYDLSSLSKRVLFGYLEAKYKNKEKTLQKLKDFCDQAYICKRKGKEFSASQCDMSWKEFNNTFQKFEDIGVSPIPADDECPYIPGIKDMLRGARDDKLLRFAERKTRGKEMWYV